MEEDFIQNRFGYCFYECKKDSALIYNLFVYPEFRRQGKAKRLLRLVINEIRDSGYAGAINITVSPKDESVNIDRLSSFYQILGLKITE